MVRNVPLFILLTIGLVITQPSSSAIATNSVEPPTSEPHYHLTSNYPSSIQRDAINIIAPDQNKKRLLAWLDQIAQVDKGRQTLLAIILSGHQLTIKHSAIATLSAGRTIAPMTDDLINGKGASVTIIFDMNIPDSGSHQVYDDNIRLIEFNAIQNLYHELAHAMHQMNGTWRYFASEKQAIEEENIFRRELAISKGKTPKLRYGKFGVLIENYQRDKERYARKVSNQQ